MNLEKYPGAKEIAILVTCASVLQIAESFLPRPPIPGIRLGLANMIAIVVLVDLGFAAAIEVAILRTVISSLLMGSFFSPAFMLSFCSAITSTLVMGAAFLALRRLRVTPLSLTGISILGALTHNATQIFLVYLVLIKSRAVFLLMPWLGISAVIMGFVTGVIASKICEKLTDWIPENRIKNEDDSPVVFKLSSDTDVHVPGKISPQLKIIISFIFAAVVMVFTNLYFFIASLLLILLIAIWNKMRLALVFKGIVKAKSFILFSLFVPAFFNGGGKILFEYGFIRITDLGLAEGGMFAFRLILLMASAGLLTVSTRPAEMARGMEKVLRPFKILGINPARISAIIACAWVNLPAFWERTVVLTKKYGKGIKPGLKSLVATAAAIIVALYTEAKENQ